MPLVWPSPSNHGGFTSSNSQYLQAPSTLTLNMGTNGGLTIFVAVTLYTPATSTTTCQHVYDCGQGQLVGVGRRLPPRDRAWGSRPCFASRSTIYTSPTATMEYSLWSSTMEEQVLSV